MTKPGRLKERSEGSAAAKTRPASNRQDSMALVQKQLLQRFDELCRRLGMRRQELVGDPGCEDDSRPMEITAGLSEIETKELANVTAALHAIRLGTYRICADCSSKIPVARMKAMPTATRCVGCQKGKESGIANGDDHSDAIRQAAAFISSGRVESEVPPDLSKVQ